jgi:hypothetical protein
MADGMIRPTPGQKHAVGGVLAIIPEPECPPEGAVLQWGGSFALFTPLTWLDTRWAASQMACCFAVVA